MNDAELYALAVVVNAESGVRTSVNLDRLHNGFSLAYDEDFPYLDILVSELRRRGVIPC